jgi:RNA polymerase sigma-70 factor (ECF subfamily)
MAMLVLLEALSPEQRAVVLLRDVFDYSYDEIARIVDKRPEAVRQLAVRARRHLEDGRPRFDASREQQEELVARFLAAAREGNLADLESLLAHDVTLTGDGGGKAPALARQLHGRVRVAHTLMAWLNAGRRIAGATVEPVEVNAGPGALFLDGQRRVIAVWSLDVQDGVIRNIRSVVNPDKLRHIGPTIDLKTARG